MENSFWSLVPEPQGHLRTKPLPKQQPLIKVGATPNAKRFSDACTQDRVFGSCGGLFSLSGEPPRGQATEHKASSETTAANRGRRCT